MAILRVGAVPYLNARPLVAGLDRASGVDYSEHVPSRLADMLRQGSLDCALVSSIEASRIPGATIVDAPCIASEGPVWSVKIVGARDPRDARSVALDGASRTAAALTRIVYSRFLGRSGVEFREVAPAPDPVATGADATLLIGDAALREGSPPPLTLDLGSAWTDSERLPFVWAVWLARPGADRDRLAELLNAAAAEGIPRSGEIARRDAPSLGISQSLATDYLERVIRFALGDREREGLARFVALAGT